MDLISREEFIDLVKYNNRLGITNEMIIENAAVKFIKHIDLERRDTFAIVAGTGDNGAYGLAIARNLIALNKYVEIFIVNTKDIRSKEFNSQFEILSNLNARINKLETIGELSDFSNDITRVNTIIDALTGIDYEASFFGSLEFVVDTINKSRIYTMSVDIPSGLDYDTGFSKFQYIDADIVITYHKMKEALNIDTGLYKREVIIEKIGLIER